MSREISAIREVDLKMAALYKDFLPEKLFDAHMHIYAKGTIPSFYGPEHCYFREEVTPEDYCADMRGILPGVKEIRLHMIPMPDKAFLNPSRCLQDRTNSYIRELVLRHPHHVGSAYITGFDDESKIRAMVAHSGIRALKCYYMTSRHGMDPNAAISDFLPEAAWVVANEKKLAIFLHIMRPNGLADPDNFSYIMDMTARYPNAQLVLAHCGRGFVSWTAVKQIPRILNRDNIWFDLAAICEVGPIMAAVLQNAGKRVLWGTDWPICLYRGRAVSIGLGQEWFYETNDKPTGYGLLAAESLLAFYQAALLMGLDQTQVDDIFYNNAISLFEGK